MHFRKWISDKKVSFHRQSGKLTGKSHEPSKKPGSEIILPSSLSVSQEELNAGTSAGEFQHPLERSHATVAGKTNSCHIGIKDDNPEQRNHVTIISVEPSFHTSPVLESEVVKSPPRSTNEGSHVLNSLETTTEQNSRLAELSLTHNFASESAHNTPTMAPQFLSPDRNLSQPPSHLALTYNTVSHVESNTNGHAVKVTGNNNNIQVQGTDKGTKALKLLAQYSNPDAELTAGARYPPPRCHPGTRETLLSAVLNWIENSKREKQVYWLHGAAGVGKSAFAQTLAERAKEKGMLGGTFFFSRPSNRNDPNTVFPTIARRLAVTNLDYQREVTRVLAADNELLKANFMVQFEELIVKPLGRIQMTDKLLIVLDGLDECKGKENQCQIVELVMQAVRLAVESPLPVIWVICSRPERHLKRLLDRKNIQELFWIEELHVNSSKAQADAEQYIRSEFERIQEKFSDAVDEEWPGEEKLLRLIEASSGLFAFSSTLLRFIDDENCGDPERQLDIVMRTLNKSLTSKDNVKSLRNPLDMLYNLYMKILEEIHPDIIDDTLLLLHSYCWLQGENLLPSKVQDFANVIGLNKGRCYSVIGNLRSVLQVDEKSFHNAEITFYHASFFDFLLDPRAGCFCFDVQQIESALRQRVIKIMNSDALLALVFQSMKIEPTISIDLSIFPWPCNNQDAALIVGKTIFDAFLRLATEQDIKQFDFRKCTYLQIPAGSSFKDNISLKGRSLENLEKEFRDLEEDIPDLMRGLISCEDDWSHESPSRLCWSATNSFHLQILQEMMKTYNIEPPGGDIFADVRIFLRSTLSNGYRLEIVFLGYAERSIICIIRQSAIRPGHAVYFFSSHQLSTGWPQYPELKAIHPRTVRAPWTMLGGAYSLLVDRG